MKSKILPGLIDEAQEAKTLYEITESMFNGWEGFPKDTATVQEVIDSGVRYRKALNAIQSILEYLDDLDIDHLIDLEDMGLIH